jgi:short-subunit dehydrogenase
MAKSVAVVTGASQAIGQATAVRLARDFSALALVARNRANLEKTAALVRDTGAEALIIDADLGSREVDDGQHDSHGRRRDQGHLGKMPSPAVPPAPVRACSSQKE